MKIAAAEVLGVGCELTGESTVLRLTTDDGTTGLGQSGGWGYPKGVAAVLTELTPLLIGADPFRIEHIWHLAHRARPFRSNLLSAAVSAIDLALWDIKGKAVGMPVWELLGGRTRDRVRLHALVGGATPDEIVSSVNWAVEEGFTAVKFDPIVQGYEDLSMAQLVSSACSMAAAAREAGGDEVDLIFELHRKLDPATRDRGLRRPSRSSTRSSSRIRSRSTRSRRRPSSPSASPHRSRWASASARSGSSASCSRATSPSSCGPTSGSPGVSRGAGRSPRSPRRITAASRPTTSSVPASRLPPCTCAPRSRTS